MRVAAWRSVATARPDVLRSFFTAMGAITAALCFAATPGCHARPRTWSPGPPELGASSGASTRHETGRGEIDEIDLTSGAPEAPSASIFRGLGRSSTTYFHLVSAV